MENKTILFTVGADGAVSPSTEQKAGSQGSHNATQVRFDVEAISGLFPGSKEKLARIQFIDGAGGFHSTGFLNVLSDEIDGKLYVSTPLSDDVTNAGGLAYVYLVVSEITYNGEDAPATENQVLISSGGKLRFTHSGVGSPSEYAYRTRISNALVNAETFVGQAERASDDSKGYRDKAGEYASDAAVSANSAADSLQELKDGIANGYFKGEPGPQGPQGPQGDKGDKGEPGETPSLDGVIQYWQPNTEYKVGDVCLAGCMVDDWPVHAICACIEEHTSDYDNAPTNFEQKVWNKVYVSAGQSYEDVLGNVIHTTYATKEEIVGTLGTINEVLATLVEVE